MKTYKETYSLQERKELLLKDMKNNPNRVILIIEKHPKSVQLAHIKPIRYPISYPDSCAKKSSKSSPSSTWS